MIHHLHEITPDLTIMEFSPYFQDSLADIKWPQKLKKLYLYGQTLDNVKLPDSLQELYLSMVK